MPAWCIGRHRGTQAIDGERTTPVDVLDEDERFITSAVCELAVQAGTRWGGTLTGIEPNKRLVSGRYHLRWRDGTERVVIVRARQRIGARERYPFVGEGKPPAAGGA